MTRSRSGWAHATAHAHKNNLAKTELQHSKGKHRLDQTPMHVSNKERQKTGVKDHGWTNSHANMHTDTSPKKHKGESRTKNKKVKSRANHPEVQEQYDAEVDALDGGEFHMLA